MEKKGQTILYIEDDPNSRRLVEKTLQHAGFTVIVAECGLEGIDLARSHKPDLILTDINLPDLSGREITTTLRSDPQFQKTPIVALTAQGLGEQRDMALAAGVTGYLTKPIDVMTLPDQVEHYMNGARDDSLAPDQMLEAHNKYTREVVGRLEKRIRDLESANSELRRLDKMKNAFIQVTAHELRTPLTLVYGYSRLIEENSQVQSILNNDPGIKVVMQGMTDGITRMQNIIHEIVTISRIMTQDIEVAMSMVNLGEIVQKALDKVQADADKTYRKVTIHFNKREWPMVMRGDAELLELIFVNLIGNAIKYTPDERDVHLKARVDRKAGTVRCSVKDSGIGIDPPDQHRIFDKFNSTGDTTLHSTSKTAFRGGGLGIGLAICKGIVQAHGGKIWVVSERYDPQTLPGSEFVVELPLGIQAHA